MKNLGPFFPGCSLPEEKIRESIRTILCFEDEYNCYFCFKFIKKIKLGVECKKCFQVYCKECAEKLNHKNVDFSEVCIFCKPVPACTKEN